MKQLAKKRMGVIDRNWGDFSINAVEEPSFSGDPTIMRFGNIANHQIAARQIDHLSGLIEAERAKGHLWETPQGKAHIIPVVRHWHGSSSLAVILERSFPSSQSGSEMTPQEVFLRELQKELENQEKAAHESSKDMAKQATYKVDLYAAARYISNPSKYGALPAKFTGRYLKEILAHTERVTQVKDSYTIVKTYCNNQMTARVTEGTVRVKTDLKRQRSISPLSGGNGSDSSVTQWSSTNTRGRKQKKKAPPFAMSECIEEEE